MDEAAIKQLGWVCIGGKLIENGCNEFEMRHKDSWFYLELVRHREHLLCNIIKSPERWNKNAPNVSGSYRTKEALIAIMRVGGIVGDFPDHNYCPEHNNWFLPEFYCQECLTEAKNEI